MELKMSSSMTVMQYASKFTELSRFVPELVSSERVKMRRFEEGLIFYVRNQLAWSTDSYLSRVIHASG